MEELPIEKVCQFYGEVSLTNRFALEREAQLTEQLKVANEQIKALELKIENLEAKNG